MSEAKDLVLASSLLCAKKTSLRRWILSCGKNNGMASTMAAIMSLAYRSSRRTSSPPTGGLYYDADAAALGSQSSTTQPPHLPAEEVRSRKSPIHPSQRETAPQSTHPARFAALVRPPPRARRRAAAVTRRDRCEWDGSGRPPRPRPEARGGGWRRLAAGPDVNEVRPPLLRLEVAISLTSTRSGRHCSAGPDVDEVRPPLLRLEQALQQEIKSRLCSKLSTRGGAMASGPHRRRPRGLEAEQWWPDLVDVRAGGAMATGPRRRQGRRSNGDRTSST
ncbi:hypothetical protein OsI_25688 [Oryza sativa Indica Group]|uniref:Uncharacterized protein n=1 Tax=Oryza sativa subsp. indica TaxID=39946 RepID=B8B586_ORYSI|nr:hypothetical protein OsI_25688 [Oryza sativa Indica Group]